MRQAGGVPVRDYPTPLISPAGFPTVAGFLSPDLKEESTIKVSPTFAV